MFILDLLARLVGLVYPLTCFLNSACVEYYQNVGYYMEIIENDTAWAYTNQQPQNSYSFIPSSGVCSVYGNFDYIVVGASSTGVVIVNRLSTNASVTILLLEAGVAETDFTNIPAYNAYNLALDSTWSYITTPQTTSCLGMNNTQCAIFKGMGLGGSSLIAMSMYERGNKNDYDDWASQGNPSWSYSNVLPYFIKSEHSEVNGDVGYHGLQGPLNVEYPDSTNYNSQYHAFIAAGNLVDYNGENQLGVSPTQFTTLNGVRESTAKVFLTPVANQGNVNVTTQSYVTKILIDPVTKVAYGVQFSKQGTCYTATVTKEVIVSAGSIGSPQLLLQSGIGPASDLNELGIPLIQNLSVGCNLQTSVGFMQLLFTTNYTLPSRSLQSNVQDYLNGTGRLTVPGNNQGVGFFQTNMTNISGLPDIELVMVPSRDNIANSIRKKLFRYTQEAYNAVWANVDQTRAFAINVYLLHPKSKGNVKLSSRNPYDFSLINPNSFSDSEGSDIETLYQGIQLAIKLVNTTGFQKLNATLLNTTPPACQGLEYLSRDYWYCSLRQLSIPIRAVGSCKMGPNFLDGAVVNNEARVHGIQQLRVADASILPKTISAGETTAVSIMIGEVVSDMIKNQQ